MHVREVDAHKMSTKFRVERYIVWCVVARKREGCKERERLNKSDVMMQCMYCVVVYADLGEESRNAPVVSGQWCVVCGVSL
jgi:hypothetical protein